MKSSLKNESRYARSEAFSCSSVYEAVKVF